MHTSRAASYCVDAANDAESRPGDDLRRVVNADTDVAKTNTVRIYVANTAKRLLRTVPMQHVFRRFSSTKTLPFYYMVSSVTISLDGRRQLIL